MTTIFNPDREKVSCPYCRAQNNLREAIAERGEDLASWQCRECEQEFRVRVHFAITVMAESIP
jgi:transposase-like protein